jgi:hypothetical protein
MYVLHLLFLLGASGIATTADDINVRDMTSVLMHDFALLKYNIHTLALVLVLTNKRVILSSHNIFSSLFHIIVALQLTRMMS